MIADLTGALPEPGAPGELVLFLGCDTHYAIRHAVPFAYALDDNAPGYRLHLHLVDPADGLEAALAALDQDLSHTTLSVTRETADLSGFDALGKRTYYAAIRFVRAFQIMEATGAALLVLDADSLVRAPLDAPKRALEAGCDLGLVVDDDAPAHMRIKAGCVLVAPTAPGRRFLGAVAANIAAHLGAGSAPWFLDQAVLFQVLEAMRETEPPAVHCFAPGFLDWGFSDSGVIWTGKGPRKEADPRYAGLAERFRARFERGAVADRFWKRAA